MTFHTYHIPYNFVCGRAVGYAYYQPRAFYYSTTTGFNTIDDPYLSGLSITNRMRQKRQHIWSYVAGYRDTGASSANCPCATSKGLDAPKFVGHDFFCESGSPTHQPSSGIPPTHSGIEKAATVVASTAAPVVDHGSSRPCRWKLHLTLRFAGASQLRELLVKELALNSLKSMYSNT